MSHLTSSLVEYKFLLYSFWWEKKQQQDGRRYCVIPTPANHFYQNIQDKRAAILCWRHHFKPECTQKWAGCKAKSNQYTHPSTASTAQLSIMTFHPVPLIGKLNPWTHFWVFSSAKVQPDIMEEDGTCITTPYLESDQHDLHIKSMAYMNEVLSCFAFKRHMRLIWVL